MTTDRKAVKQFILEKIDLEGYGFTPETDNDKILCAYNVCLQEVGHMKDREGTQAMIEYWFSGLCSVISLPYLYADIIPLAVKWGGLPADHTDRQADKICQNWFRYMAAQFLQMVNKAQRAPLAAL